MRRILIAVTAALAGCAKTQTVVTEIKEDEDKKAAPAEGAVR